MMFENIHDKINKKYSEEFLLLYLFGVQFDEDKITADEEKEESKIYFTVPKELNVKYTDNKENIHHVVSDSEELIKLAKNKLIKLYSDMYDEYEKQFSFLSSVILGTKDEYLSKFHFYTQIREDIWTTEDYEKEKQKWIDIAKKESQWKEV